MSLKGYSLTEDVCRLMQKFHLFIAVATITTFTKEYSGHQKITGQTLNNSHACKANPIALALCVILVIYNLMRKASGAHDQGWHQQSSSL